MWRVLSGWVLACCFFAAQTHAQHERLLRSQPGTPLAAQCEQHQPLPASNHLGCSTTRALKPSVSRAWLSHAATGLTTVGDRLDSLSYQAGLRAEPPPMRTAERPVLRI